MNGSVLKIKRHEKLVCNRKEWNVVSVQIVFFFLLFFSFLNLFGIFFYSSVSSIQQTTNTPTTNKQTDMLPTSNIIYSMNKHSLNSDYDKLKQEEVLFVIFFQSNKLN